MKGLRRPVITAAFVASFLTLLFAVWIGEGLKAEAEAERGQQGEEAGGKGRRDHRAPQSLHRSPPAAGGSSASR